MDYYHKRDQITGTRWADHRSNGGTGVTKFGADRLPLYQKAVAELGDSEIFLKGNELHSCREKHDLSDFWEVFWRLKAHEATI